MEITSPSGAGPGAGLDGRRLRRERGRLAVLDATIDLVFEGHGPPAVERVAERAGVSAASVFRYFAGLDELRHQTVERYFERYGHLLEVPDLGEGPLSRRIERLVGARIRYHETAEPMARLARHQAVEIGELRDVLARVRGRLGEQVDRHFAPELDKLEPEARAELVAVMASLISFESWDQLRERGLGRDRIGRALREGLGRLLVLEGEG